MAQAIRDLIKLVNFALVEIFIGIDEFLLAVIFLKLNLIYGHEALIRVIGIYLFIVFDIKV